ncbi:DNA oxidative demethylase ALKBH2 [Trichoderma ghanense]|uniref:DNA oxidative demethylase ALKBH2 n=1 Tax=Trichoderma ghanense TaxID=65468 RepID=A0ABY2GRJ3_9HYPO
MFAFDPSALPQLTTRKALIVVDLQNDFVDAADGGLPVTQPDGFVDRTIEVANAFRSVGDVIWVQSQFDKARGIDSDQIILSDNTPTSQSKSKSGVIQASADDVSDAEAFLSHEEPSCVKPSHPGCSMPRVVAEAVRKTDITLTKSHYSAFHGTHLLRSLRGKMVMEVFICGSLANIGVYATAMDAAGHGMAITVIKDCCGYRHESRQAAATKSLVELTGCEFLSSQEVLSTLPPAEPESKASPEAPKLPSATGTSTAEDITQSLLELKLDSSPSDPANVAKETSSEPVSKKESQGSETANVLNQAAGIISQPSVEDGMAKADDPVAASVEPDNESDLLAQQKLCEGDADVIMNALPSGLAEEAFEKLEKEVLWQRMSHQGGEVPRLVAVQGEVSEDGTMPVYRHPADESPPLLPFSPTVEAIKVEVEKHLGHPLNHVLIQFYRDGNDYISEHSDKTLDIVRGSYIANLSLGAERTMTLRTKKLDKGLSGAASDDGRRKIQRAKLSHNSLFRMGLQTNMKWLHAIRRDRRADRDRSAAELAYSSRRISLTFRRIGTFLDRDETIIWGQGATGKTRESAHAIKNGQSPDAVSMIRAFGMENHASDFDWDAHYGGGFDVLHISNSPRFFASADPIVNMRIVLMLTEFGIKFAKGSMASGADIQSSGQSNPSAFWSPPVKFVDNDAARSVVQGDMAIMLYLYSRYGPGRSAEVGSASHSPEKLAVLYSQLQQGLNLLHIWRHVKGEGDVPGGALPGKLKQELAVWDGYRADKSKGRHPAFLCGDTLTLPDFATWPVLHSIVEEYGLDVTFKGMDRLRTYYEAVRQLDSVAAAVGSQ